MIYISIWLMDKGGLRVPWSRIYPYPQSIVMPHRTLLHSSLACLYAELPHQLALCGTQWSLKQGWWYVCQSKINKTSVLSFVLCFMKYHLNWILHCPDWPPIVRGKISHLSLVLYVQMIICHKEGWYKFEIRCLNPLKNYFEKITLLSPAWGALVYWFVIIGPL